MSMRQERTRRSLALFGCVVLWFHDMLTWGTEGREQNETDWGRGRDGDAGGGDENESKEDNPRKKKKN